MIIRNGKDLPLGQSSSALPDASTAIKQFLQPVTIGVIQKRQIGGYTQSIVEKYIQTAASRTQKPISIVFSKTGERVFDAMDIYMLNAWRFTYDDLFLFEKVQYRVVMVEDWSDYGYMKYSVVQDYTKLFITNPIDI